MPYFTRKDLPTLSLKDIDRPTIPTDVKDLVLFFPRNSPNSFGNSRTFKTKIPSPSKTLKAPFFLYLRQYKNRNGERAEGKSIRVEGIIETSHKGNSWSIDSIEIVHVQNLTPTSISPFAPLTEFNKPITRDRKQLEKLMSGHNLVPIYLSYRAQQPSIQKPLFDFIDLAKETKTTKKKQKESFKAKRERIYKELYQNSRTPEVMFVL